MKNSVKLNNVMFPIWFFLLLPQTWIVIIPANFIIDSAVVLITLKCLKINDIKGNYKKSILRVFLFGFLADFIGEGFMLISQFIPGDWWYENIINNVAFNPYENILSFLYVMIALLIAGFFIYLFNIKFSFKNTSLTKHQQKVLSLTLAITTSPYLFLIPSKWIYK